ncbi:hypothetical protein K2X14_07785 [Acetobacter sp. TBRC 12305]|uniref:Methyltransferase n=1 Tax=Acetobacter garciniae TaxID=2817435 RepID=A0A939HIZ0_9PROT|nr:hypothetical protein [Acetobacter garciniae]MBO1325295.1 hypothetical protein [Acetobacter garciniae]MBX0344733.1 hypothetical protein [Acetobacter garciniae]
MKASGFVRQADDWYVEPAWCVDALVRAERPFVGSVLDPCCGGGNIVGRLEAAGVAAIGSDLRDRTEGSFPVIGFDDALPLFRPASVVSNPPYGRAQDMIDRSLECTQDRVCVLLRLAFLEGQKRRDWFENVPLARVWVCSRRVSMPPGGTEVKPSGGAIAYAWFVFEHGWRGQPVVGFLADGETT